MGLRGDEAQVEAQFGLFGDSANLELKNTVSSKIVLEAPNGTPRCCGSCGISFRSVFEIVLASVQDRCSICVKHTIGSLMVLDAPDDTPR
jgi:hypothetical protein